MGAKESGESVLPLANFRVVDFGTAWAGPMAAQLLGDLGAQVIKVESRARLDGLRLGRPIIGDNIAEGDRGLWPELQPVFHGINRNKLSITLNLKTDMGLDLAKQLIAGSDVVMNNYSPGVLERLDLDYPNLSRLRPDIILVSMPSVGETGPLRDILAYAPIIQALSGFMSLVGYGKDEPLVGELQAPWSDAVASLHAGLAAVAALKHRNRTGEGQFIEVAQLEATTSMLGEAILGYQMTGETPSPQGNRDEEFAPHSNYRCAGEDQWVAIAVGSEEEWQSFCQALDNPEWTRSPKFAHRADRLRHQEELDEEVSGWTSTRAAQEITALLQAHGVAAMPVMNIADQFSDPHLSERQFYVDIDHPHVGAEWISGMPWQLSDTPGQIRTPAPLLGQHNDYILGELLGLSAESLAALESQGVVY
ncbi:MAG: CaiB/BaiF CoA transferase family protein [Dehalococcoidia bacterium]